MTTEKTKRILTVRIEEPLFLEVRAEAGGSDRTNAQVVTEALREFFSRPSSKPEAINPSKVQPQG